MCIVIQRENEKVCVWGGGGIKHPPPHRVDGSIIMSLELKHKQSHCVGMRTEIGREEVTSVLML